jgi:hypothetical protein
VLTTASRRYIKFGFSCGSSLQKLIYFSVLREQIIPNFFLPIRSSNISSSCRRWRKSISVQFDGDFWTTTDEFDCDNMGDFDRIHFVHSLGSWFA